MTRSPDILACPGKSPPTVAWALVRQRNEESRLFHTVVQRRRDSSLADLTARDRSYGVGVAAVSSEVAMLIGVAIIIGVAMRIVVAIGVAAFIALISIVGAATTPQA